MAYRFSKKTLSRMDGVDPKLVCIASTAILISKVDFFVPKDGGLRNINDQTRLVASGASNTMDSDHLYGKAIDLVPYVDGVASYHWPHYFTLASAMVRAARWHRLKLYWGGYWGRIDNAESIDELQILQTVYANHKRSQGKKPFLDGAHFYIER